MRILVATMSAAGRKPRCPASATCSSASLSTVATKPGVEVEFVSLKKIAAAGARFVGKPSPVTPIAPTSRPFLYSGTPPGESFSEPGRIVLPRTPGEMRRASPGADDARRSFGSNGDAGASGFAICFRRLMSEKNKFEKPTPTSGPGGVFATPGGKCCWMI